MFTAYEELTKSLTSKISLDIIALAPKATNAFAQSFIVTLLVTL